MPDVDCAESPPAASAKENKDEPKAPVRQEAPKQEEASKVEPKEQVKEDASVKNEEEAKVEPKVEPKEEVKEEASSKKKEVAADASQPDAPKETPKEESQSLEVLEDLIGWLIGPGASGVMEIERLSGSRIEVSREPAVDGKKKVVIRGSEVQVARGRVLLEDKLRSAPATSAGEGGTAAEAMGTAEAAPAATIMLAGHRFVGRSDIMDYIRKLQSSIAENQMVGPEDAFFLFHLLTYHPNFKEKMSSPVVGFKYGEHEAFPGSKCFFVVRVDGTQEGISVAKALDVIVPKGRGAKRAREEEPASSAPSRGAEEGASAEPPAKRQREITTGCILEIDGVPSNLAYEDLRDILVGYSHFKFLELLNPKKEKGGKNAKDSSKAMRDDATAKEGSSGTPAEVAAKAESPATDGETAMKVDSTSTPAESPTKAEGEAANGLPAAKIDSSDKPAEVPAKDSETAMKVDSTEKPAEVPAKVEGAAVDGEAAMKVDSTEKPADAPVKVEGAAVDGEAGKKLDSAEKPADVPAKAEGAATVKSAEAISKIEAAPAAAVTANAEEEDDDDDEDDEEDEEEEVVLLKARARFASADSAAKAAEEIKELNGKPVSVTILQGEEERNFWERLWEAADRKQEKSDGKGKKGKGKDGKGKGKKGKGKKGKGKGKKDR